MRIRLAISAHLKIVFVVHMNFKEIRAGNDNARHLFIIDNFLEGIERREAFRMYLPFLTCSLLLTSGRTNANRQLSRLGTSALFFR